MQFRYNYIDTTGKEHFGTIEAVSEEVAISALQRRGLTIASIMPVGKNLALSSLSDLPIFQRVKTREIVILSRQIATLFNAQVSALRVFRLLADEAENPVVQQALLTIADDMQAGNSISKALAKHDRIFTPFYVNMVRAGEESGRLSETFMYLADYLDRNYTVTSKAKNALVYPAFVIATFVVVMVLLMTFVIPRISTILTESGGEIPFYTRIIIGISNILSQYFIFIVAMVIVAGVFIWRYSQTKQGREAIDSLRLSIPYVNNLYRKLYLARIADNMSTLLGSGVSMVRSIEITASVVGNVHYEHALLTAMEKIKGGALVSESLSEHREYIPGIMTQMIHVGEETGELGSILKTLSTFYTREVENAVDTLVGLIEPAMIVLLGFSVGIVIASVLLPIYNITATI